MRYAPALSLVAALLAVASLAASLAAAALASLNPLFVDLPWIAAPLALPGLVGIATYLRLRRARIAKTDDARASTASLAASLAAAAISPAAAIVWLAAAAAAPSSPVPAKVIVFGVDGGTFAVIDEMGDSLPAFARLRREGARAVLRSMEPMFSPVLWTTIASGRTPDDHGVRGFYVHSDDCKVARFWDIAEENHQRVGLYKWLVDYPPRQIPGFWVPSWLAPATETWPPELSVVKEIELSRRLRRKQVAAARSTLAAAPDLVRAGLRLSTALRAAAYLARERLAPLDPVRANVEMQLLRGWIDRDVFIRQLYNKSPDIASLTYYATDGLAHLYWDRHLQGGPEVRSAYRQADAILAELLARRAPDARILLFSDHGFTAMDAAGMEGQFAPTTERLKARLSATLGPVDVSRVGAKLTVGLQSEAQRAPALAAIDALRDDAGQPFYTVSDTPDSRLTLALTLAQERVPPDRLASGTVGGEPLRDYVTLNNRFTGTHRDDGIFYALGPSVPPGTSLPDLSLLDAAPTILAAANLPASQEMPGRAVLFPELPRVNDWDHLLENLSWLDGAEGVEEERLRQLGYISN